MSKIIEIKATRWPWQEKGRWNKNGLGRFGGGWQYSFGFELGSFSKRGCLILNLLFGIVRISWDIRGKLAKQEEIERDAKWKKDREKRLKESEILKKIKEVMMQAATWDHIPDPKKYISEQKNKIDEEYGEGTWEKNKYLI